VLDLNRWVDGFGIGTSISTASVIDFGGKIVAVEDDRGNEILRSKRGDLAGTKNVYRDPSTFTDVVTLSSRPPNGNYKPLLRPLIRRGKIVAGFLSPDELRRRTTKTVKAISKGSPQLRWQ